MFFCRLSQINIQRPSFRKSKKNVAEEPVEEVSTITTKVPRKGVLGKMGLKKKEKSKVAVTKPEPVEEQKPEPVEEAAPAEEPAAAPVEEAPVVEEAPEEAPEEEERDEAAILQDRVLDRHLGETTVGDGIRRTW